MTPEMLAALHANCFTTPRPWSADEFASLLATPGAFLLTAGADGCAGFLLGRVAAGEAELLTLAVDPRQRRAGLGRGLVAAFLDRTREAGAAAAFLEVAADNGPARALYAAAGFAEAGRRPRYYRKPDGTAADALVLSRPIDPQK